MIIFDIETNWSDLVKSISLHYEKSNIETKIWSINSKVILFLNIIYLDLNVFSKKEVKKIRFSLLKRMVWNKSKKTRIVSASTISNQRLRVMQNISIWFMCMRIYRRMQILHNIYRSLLIISICERLPSSNCDLCNSTVQSEIMQ